MGKCVSMTERQAAAIRLTIARLRCALSIARLELDCLKAIASRTRRQALGGPVAPGEPAANAALLN